MNDPSPIMYFANNNACGKLGDSLIAIKVCWLAVKNYPNHRHIMTMFKHQRYDSLWSKFIREKNVEVYWEEPVADIRKMRKLFNERYAKKMFVHGGKEIKFDRYIEPICKEEDRQKVKHFDARNIIQLFYFGQADAEINPEGTSVFDDSLIDWTADKKYDKGGVFISPEEYAQGNVRFSLSFYEKLIRTLCTFQIPVVLNSCRLEFLHGFSSPFITRTCYGISELTNQIASQNLVICGNTGTGWLSAATGAHFLALEMENLGWWSFKENGCKTLVKTIHHPNLEDVFLHTLAILKLKGIEGFYKIK